MVFTGLTTIISQLEKLTIKKMSNISLTLCGADGIIFFAGARENKKYCTANKEQKNLEN